MTFDEPSPETAIEPGDVIIRVIDEDGCWRLECPPVFETVMFPCGRAAEAAGRSLAARLACAGRGVRMTIENRSRVAQPGRHDGPPSPSHPPAPIFSVTPVLGVPRKFQ